jgi:ArsR family transcriptional regulator
MDERQALAAFAALGQEHRLRVVRALVTAGPDGLAAGVLAETVGVAGNNLSFHLKELSHAGLVVSRREGKSIIYTAAYTGLSDLVQFLMQDCCGGRPEICTPAITALEACLCEPSMEPAHV